MRRTISAIMLLSALNVIGCSTDSQPAAPSIVASAPSAAPTRSAVATIKKSTPKVNEWDRCGPNRDIIVRYVTSGLLPSAQKLGAYNLGTCQPTLDSLRQTSPTSAGYCTQAAWASDNPGYTTDGTPAKPLKKVIEAIGPAC
jgi:hypothetical protein